MKNTNKLTVPDLISIGVFTAFYFVLVAVATFSSVLIFPGFNNVVLSAFCALISGSVYMLMVAKVQKFGAISLYLEKPFASASNTSFAFVIFEISEFRYIDTSFSRREPGEAMRSIIFSRTLFLTLISLL